VLVNGDAVSSCLYLAAFVDGAEVVTVEHLAKDGKLDPVQEAFIEAGAFQCGFCTPGFVIMTKQLLEELPEPSDDEIRHLFVGQSVPLWRLSRDHPGSEACRSQRAAGYSG
jgi:carbon-monoxide dehydrogenase small subunit